MNDSGEERWRDLVFRLSEINRAVAEADIHQIWRYGVQKDGASEAALTSMEAMVGGTLDGDYRTVWERARARRP